MNWLTLILLGLAAWLLLQLRAWQNFFMQSTGNDTFSGTDTTTSAKWSNPAGIWLGSTTNTLAVVDGSASAAAVNDWVNIGGGWITQISAVTNLATSYTFTMTNTGYGVKPGSATLGVADGGSWKSPACTVLTGSGTITTSTQVLTGLGNVTFTLTGATNWQLKGAAATPLVYCGSSVNWGDCSTGSSTAGIMSSSSFALPTINASTFTFTHSGIASRFLALNLPGSKNGDMFVPASSVSYEYCRFIGTGSGTSSVLVHPNNASAQLHFGHCYFTQPNTATAMVQNSNNTTLTFEACQLIGTGSATTQVGILSSAGGSALTVSKTRIVTLGSHAISFSGSNQLLSIRDTTLYKPGADGIRITAAPLLNSEIVDVYCYLSGSNSIGVGYDFNNTSGAAITMVVANNVHNSPASGTFNGFGDLVELNPITDTGNPFVNAPSDLRLVAGSLGAGAAWPGQWENQTAGIASTPDVGADQRAVGTSGVANLIGPSLIKAA